MIGHVTKIYPTDLIKYLQLTECSILYVLTVFRQKFEIEGSEDTRKVCERNGFAH